MAEPTETRPRRVTASSEERCRKAFDEWWHSVNTYSQTIFRGDEIAYDIWRACWRYLERKVHEEFISK